MQSMKVIAWRYVGSDKDVGFICGRCYKHVANGSSMVFEASAYNDGALCSKDAIRVCPDCAIKLLGLIKMQKRNGISELTRNSYADLGVE